jgi:nucleoside-diphosphate-sugar epimerase
MVYKKKKITIFGYTGFIGSNLLLNLKKSEVFLPKRNILKYKNNLGDIIYCIGSHEWRQKPYKAFNSDVSMIMKILNNNTYESFNLISSTRIYKNNSSKEKNNITVNPSEEDDYYNCLKILAENLVLMNKRNRVIRISNVFGNNYSSKIFLPSIIRDALNRKKIILKTNKYSEKDFIFVDEAARIIIKIAKFGKENIYNVAFGKNFKIGSIVKKLKKLTSCDIIYDNKSKIIKNSVIDITKIKKEFNFSPKIDVLRHMKTLINNFKRHNKK